MRYSTAMPATLRGQINLCRMLRSQFLWIKLQFTSARTFARDVAQKTQIVPSQQPLNILERATPLKTSSFTKACAMGFAGANPVS